MKELEYVITAVNRLSGLREEISRPMPMDEARSRLERELAARRRQRFAPYTQLRVERRLPVQLSFDFKDYE